MSNICHKGRKGILPVTAVILLLTVGVVIVGVAFMWMSMSQRAGHAIQLDNVHFDTSKTIIYVRNIGEGTVTLDSVHIEANSFLVTTANCTVGTEPSTTITQGSTAEIIVNQAYTQKVHIKVICTDGTFIEGDWKP